MLENEVFSSTLSVPESVPWAGPSTNKVSHTGCFIQIADVILYILVESQPKTTWKTCESGIDENWNS